MFLYARSHFVHMSTGKSKYIAIQYIPKIMANKYV